MLHHLGQQQAADHCILQEDQPECFLELAATNDGAYITINSNAKTASQVGGAVANPIHSIWNDTISCDVDVSLCIGYADRRLHICNKWPAVIRACGTQIFFLP